MTNPSGLLVTPVGFDSNGNLLPLLLGADGSVLVSGPSPSALSPIPASTQFTNLNLPAGTSTQTGFTVPAGQRHRLTSFSMSYTGTVAGVSLYAVVINGAVQMTFNFVAPPVTGVFYLSSPNVLLEAGWKVGVIVLGATLNDDLVINMFLQREQ